MSNISTIDVPLAFFEYFFLNKGYDTRLQKFFDEAKDSDLCYDIDIDEKKYKEHVQKSEEDWDDEEILFENILNNLIQSEFQKCVTNIQTRASRCIEEQLQNYILINYSLFGLIKDSIQNNYNEFPVCKKLCIRLDDFFNERFGKIIKSSNHNYITFCGAANQYENFLKKIIGFNYIDERTTDKSNSNIIVYKDGEKALAILRKVFKGEYVAYEDRLRWNLARENKEGGAALVYFLKKLIDVNLIEIGEKKSSRKFNQSICVCFKNNLGDDFTAKNIIDARSKIIKRKGGSKSNEEKIIDKLILELKTYQN